MLITIDDIFVKEASDYATASRAYTSNRHDFHEGGYTAKEKKMFEGKLGEKAVKQFFLENNILFEEDNTSHEVEDMYDFLVWVAKTEKELKVDVKTRTESFHVRTLEMVEQINKNPKDIYISVRLYKDKQPYQVDLIGYAFRSDFLNEGTIENQGYLDNYVLYDRQLRPINQLIENLKKNEI